MQCHVTFAVDLRIGLKRYPNSDQRYVLHQQTTVAPKVKDNGMFILSQLGDMGRGDNLGRTPCGFGQRSIRTLRVLIGCWLVQFVMFNATSEAQDTLEYNADIRPILADACFACHGPDSASRKADLRLDQRATAIEMGAIIVGDPESSEMIRRIESEDPDEVMPPPETKKTLTPQQKARLAAWIRGGAEYQLHWSLIAPERPQLPAVKNQAWARNPIDQFVLAKLESMGLEPAAEADRYTLARRLSLDLTGLPPKPEQVQKFVHDSSANAYECYVDELLESPQWGEHRARYWLDYARYADTHGIHFDNYREMWSYRDWVIKAFNQNMPFDQFTIENLAGDLLPNATLDQQIGSGFNRCNMTTNEGGIIDEEYMVLYTRDRTETTSQVWLGLTANCAVCHSHKFDPLTQQEFYEMSAFFNNSTQGARDGNIQDTPPIVVVPKFTDRQRWNALPAELASAESALSDRRATACGEFDTWLANATVEALGQPISNEALHLVAPLSEGEGNHVRIQLDGQPRDVVLTSAATWESEFAGHPALHAQGAACELPEAGRFDSDQPFTCTAWIRVPANDGYGAICARMDSANAYRGWDFWLQQRRVGMHLVSAWPDQGLKVVGRDQIPANQWVHVAVSYDGSGKAAGVKVYYDGQPQPTNTENDRLSGPTQTEVPWRIGQRSAGEAFTGGIQDLRIYSRSLSAAEVATLAKLSRFVEVLAKAPADRSDEERNALYEHWLVTIDPVYCERQQCVDALRREQEEIKSRGTIAHVMHERDDPAMAYLLFRGEYDKRRNALTPDTPEVLPAFPAEFPRNRLGFAKWLLLPEHPLTSRVTVNRFWQEVFGIGIVKTPGDFGVSGDMPSHPLLLDWMAIEFRESGWDVKRLFKLMVMSASYRQSSTVTPEKLERDPENRLLSRGPRYRMDAEMVRDYALAASDLLVPTIGGPSVKPYQPPGVWEAIAMNVSNTRQYVPGSGDDLYRRSLYTFIKRMAPPASLELFNAPNREYCVVRRERTNTPLQALVTLNDEQFVEAARHLAEVVLKPTELSQDERFQRLAMRLLAREFRPDELEIVRQSLENLLGFYRSHPDEAREVIHVGESEPDADIDPAVLAGWTLLTNQLMNLDEVLNK